jgi:hypothetical protein
MSTTQDRGVIDRLLFVEKNLKEIVALSAEIALKNPNQNIENIKDTVLSFMETEEEIERLKQNNRITGSNDGRVN